MKSTNCIVCSHLCVKCPAKCVWAPLFKPGDEEKFSVLEECTPVDSLKKKVTKCKKIDRQKYIDNLYENIKMKCKPKAVPAETVGPSEEVGYVTENADRLLLLASSTEILQQESLRNENIEKPPSSHHVGGSSSSFTETYPHFPAWQYDIMNPNGTFSSMPLTRPERVPNVPWPDLVNVDLVEECMRMIVGFQSLARTLSSQYVVTNLKLAQQLETANTVNRTLKKRIRSLKSKNRQYDSRFSASQEGNIKGGSSRKRTRSPIDA